MTLPEKFRIVGEILVITCTDKRVARQTLNYVYRLTGQEAYSCTPPGGGKFLVDMPKDSISEHELLKFYYTHGVRTIIVFVHDDCAAYGPRFWEDQQVSEDEYLNCDLDLGESRLQSSFSGLRVYCCRAKMDRRKKKIARYIWR